MLRWGPMSMKSIIKKFILLAGIVDAMTAISES
jgi:hypothetical protein